MKRRRCYLHPQAHADELFQDGTWLRLCRYCIDALKLIAQQDQQDAADRAYANSNSWFYVYARADNGKSFLVDQAPGLSEALQVLEDIKAVVKRAWICHLGKKVYQARNGEINRVEAR